MRILIMFIAIMMLAVYFGSIGYTAEPQDHASTEENEQHMESEAVNIGNRVCPVSGEKINQDLKATYGYKGKIYNFCCAACIDEFKKDPGKYIKKVKEELKGNSRDMDGHVHEEHMH